VVPGTCAGYNENSTSRLTNFPLSPSAHGSVRMSRIALLVFCSFGAILLGTALTRSARADESPALDFQSAGVQLRGPQFMYDAAFDIIDWNYDGRQDVFLLATGTC